MKRNAKRLLDYVDFDDFDEVTHQDEPDDVTHQVVKVVNSLDHDALIDLVMENPELAADMLKESANMLEESREISELEQAMEDASEWLEQTRIELSKMKTENRRKKGISQKRALKQLQSHNMAGKSKRKLLQTVNQ